MTNGQQNAVARAAGALIVAMAVTGMFAFGVHSSLVAPGHPEETASRLAASPLLLRFEFLSYVVTFALDVAVAVLFAFLFRATHLVQAWLVGAFRLFYGAVAMACVAAFAPVVVGAAAPGAQAAMSAHQAELAAQAMTSFQDGLVLALMVFGVHLALLGALLFRTRFVPRWLGAAVAVAGLGYVTDGVLWLCAPGLRGGFSVVMIPIALSELVLALWLLVKGAPPAAAASPSPGSPQA